MAESFLDRLIKEQRQALGFGGITKPDPRIATAPAALPPGQQGYSKVPHAEDLRASEMEDLKKGVTVEPQVIGKSELYKPLSTRLWNQAEAISDNPTPPSLADLNRMPSAPKSGVVPTMAKMTGPNIPAPVPAVLPEVAIEPRPEAPIEVGPVEPQITIPEKPKGIDWNKVGEIAKGTGRSIIDILQAAVAGRTAGLAGRAFNPATETSVGVRSGKEQDKAAQKEVMAEQFGFQKQLRELDRDFQGKQDAIARDYDTKKAEADRAFQLTRDNTAYEQALKAAEADRVQQMKALQFQAKSALDLEKTRQGLPVGGVSPGLGGADVAGVRDYLPGAKK